MFLGLSGGVYSIMPFVPGEMLNVETVAENGNLLILALGHLLVLKILPLCTATLSLRTQVH